MPEFFDMGGYAAFVWPSWLAGAALILGITLESRRRLKSAQRRLERMERRRGSGAGSAPAQPARREA